MARRTFSSLALILVFGSVQSYSQVLTADSLALVALYNSTNGPNWTIKTNWLVSNRPVSTWYGVTVVGNRVTRINMNPSFPAFTGNNLDGPLPTQIGNLTALTNLDLGYNKISGTIPSQIRMLTNLTFLNLSNNRLTGAIPPEIGDLTNLSILLVSNNQLTGGIPTTIGNLIKLTQLKMAFNQLGGQLPSQLFNLVELTQLQLDNNQFTGSIPSQISLLSKLTSLSINENNFSGSIPAPIGTLSNLTELNLTQNNLNGSLPKEIGNLTNLLLLRLNRNNFTGQIPREFGNLNKLQELLLGTNQLTGDVPPEIASIGTLTNVQFQNNNLAAIPAFSKTTVTTLIVFNNNLTFEDLEPNMGITNFQYIPQKILPGAGTQNKITGNPFILPFTVGGIANQYQWRKNGNIINGATSSTLSIPSLVFLDSGFYELFITNTLVTGLTLQTEPTKLNVSGIPVIDARVGSASKPAGSNITFEITGLGTERIKELEIGNSGNAALLISDIQFTGDFSLAGSIPPRIDPGSNVILSIRFIPTVIGMRTGSMNILNNSNTPSYIINLFGEGDAELEVFNVVSTNQNGKHDFLHIRNIHLYPDNHISIFDRWGNKVYETAGYDNISKRFTGISSKGLELSEGTYYYVIDKDKASKPITGFLFLRRN